MMGLTSALTGILCAALTVLMVWWPGIQLAALGLFFALCVVHNGVRIARKTYVVDIAPKKNAATTLRLAIPLLDFYY